MKELVEHQGRLLRSGLSSNIDEVATARRKMMELMGPSGGNFFKIEQDKNRDKCWSHLAPNREQVLLTLKILKEGLKKAKVRTSQAQISAKLNMDSHLYQVKKRKDKR